MDELIFIEISKIDAAKRQLDSAVRLFFHNKDIVSTHTLTHAAWTVLKDLAEEKNVKSPLLGGMLPMVREEKKKDFCLLLNRNANFFKHADRDPKKILSFSPETTHYLLWDAIEMYHLITTEWPLNLKTFRLWFHCTKPEIFLFSDEEKNILNTIKNDFDPANKTNFYNEVNASLSLIHS